MGGFGVDYFEYIKTIFTDTKTNFKLIGQE